MAPEKTVEEKAVAGEKLSAEETTQLLQEESGPEGYKPVAIVDEETTVGAEDAPESETEAGKNKKAEEDKAAAQKVKDDAAAVAAKTAQEAEDAKDPFIKLERELIKPEGKEDLTNFSPREKAYFHQMRRDRKARQNAEADRDAARLEVIKSKKAPDPAAEAAAAAAAAAAVEEDPLKALEGKDPTDFLTVAEVTKIVKGLKQAPAAPAAAAVDLSKDPVFMKFIHTSDQEARTAHEDYDTVMELHMELINNNPERLNHLAKCIKEGKNPAEEAYQLIKADPEFATLLPLAEVKAKAKKSAAATAAAAAAPAKTAEEIEKEKKAKEAQDKLDANKNKPKTTGNVETSSDSPIDDITEQEFLAMSDREFAKLPKKKREKLLQKYGQ